MKNYLSVLKIAGISPDEGEIICSLLNIKTLDRLTKVGFDRMLIKPILQEAANMEGGINDENVNLLLDDQNLVTSMIQRYCR